MAEPSLRLVDLPSCTRLILRGREAAIAAVTAPLGFALPLQPCRAVTIRERSALWLGPDEWLLLAAPSDPLSMALSQAMAGLAHSLVDITHRQFAIELNGHAACDVLNAGCPLDLDETMFPIGMCTRTVLASSEIVLWRIGIATFHLEVARSFVPYVRAFLQEAARDYPAD